MPRCKKRRCCRSLDNEKMFKPAGIPVDETEIIEIEPDEFEAVRLCDLENLSQIEAGEKMNVSRATIQRLLQSGRAKIVESLLKSNTIVIKTEKDCIRQSKCEK